MASVNKVILVGNLGADPETRSMPSGESVTNIRIATTETHGRGDNRKEHTEWHRIAFFGKLAEIAGQYLRKGSSVYIEGRIRTRKWQDQSGQEKYSQEIIADQMQMLGGRAGGDDGGQERTQRTQYGQTSGQQRQRQQPAPAGGGDFGDEDIPFAPISAKLPI